MPRCLFTHNGTYHQPMKQITMDYTAHANLLQVARDAAKTLASIAAATPGRLKQDLHFQVEELREKIQEAIDAASVPEHSQAWIGRDQPVLDTVGYVRCIDISQKGNGTYRYFGAAGLEFGKGPTFKERETHAEAEADVKTCYRGGKVAYEQQAVVPLVPIGTSWESATRLLEAQGIARMAPMFAASQQPAGPVVEQEG